MKHLYSGENKVKNIFLIGMVCVGMLAGSLADGATNPELTPKTPKGKADIKAVPGGEQASQPESDGAVIDQLKGVVLLGRRELLQPQGVRGVAGAKVQDVSFITTPELRKVISPYLGKPAKLSDLRKMQRDIVRFCHQKHNRLLVDIWFPEQTVDEGTVQLILVEGKVNKIHVINEESKYFSDKLIKSKFHIKEGNNIDPSQLNADIDFANQNSFFREIDIALKAPDAQRPDSTDVELRVKDRFPVRVFAGYEDSGNEIIGNQRFLAGANYGNFLGLDQQLNYQFMSDLEVNRLKAHSTSYVIPLPWEHTLTAYGSYGDYKADLTKIPNSNLNPFDLRGSFYQVGGRYRVPLPRDDWYRHGLSVGFEYKYTDTDLAFGGESVFNTPLTVAQCFAEYDLLAKDRFGINSFGWQVYYSPGNWMGHNEDATFEKYRRNSDSEYVYAKLRYERQTPLFAGFSWLLKVNGQVSSDRLVSSEQLGMGGYATVRGYDERIANGDNGVIVNNEIFTPAISTGLGRVCGHSDKATFAEADENSDALQLLAFCDYGYARSKFYSGSYDNANANLCSVGVGVRYRIRNNLSVRFDWGYQVGDQQGEGNLARKAGNSDGSDTVYNYYHQRFHLGVVASF